MKRIALFLALALTLAAQIVGPGTITATVATAGTPVRLSSSNLQVKSFAVQLTTGGAKFCVGDSSVLVSSGKGTCVTGTTNNIYYPPANGLVYDLSLYFADSDTNATILAVNYNVQ